MSTPYDYEDGSFCFQISDTMAIDSDGNMMMRISDNMAMDMESGDLHLTSNWEDNDDEW